MAHKILRQAQLYPSTELKDNMATTYEKIATTTLGSATNTITFSSIDSSWTDLKLVFTVLSANGTNSAFLRFNNSSTTLYSRTTLYGTSAAGSTSAQTQTQFDLNPLHTLNTTKPEFYNIDIFSYAGSTNKTCLITGSSDLDGNGSVYLKVGLWRSTAAINRLDLIADPTGNFASGTTATLYGILKA